MKRFLTTLLFTFGFGSLFLTTPASAQYHRAQADVPFAFVVSGKTVPAGRYTISQLSSSTPVFTLQNEQESLFAQLGARETGDPAHPSVTFKRVGSRWMLIRITPPGSQSAYSLPSSVYEKNPHMKMATMVSIKLQ